MKSITKFFILATTVGTLAVAVVACGDDGYGEQVRAAQPVESTLPGNRQRVEVTRLYIFHDELAYGNDRGVYLIRDTETGTEFVGVSGIGIAEVGRHACGKGCTHEDER